MNHYKVIIKYITGEEVEREMFAHSASEAIVDTVMDFTYSVAAIAYEDKNLSTVTVERIK